MSDARIALAPMAASFVHDGVDIAPRYQCAHRHPRRIGQRGDGGRFQSRRDGGRLVEHGAWTVVIQHQVLLAEHHTLNARHQLIAGGGVLAVGVSAFDQHRLRIAQRLPERHQVVQTERATGADHVGDGVGDPQLHRNLDGTVEPNDGSLNAACRQVFSHQIGECGGDPLARKVVGGPVAPRRGGIAKRRRPETQRQPFAHRALRIPRPDRGR